jgi:adenine-specific DNA-methyltransferase
LVLVLKAILKAALKHMSMGNFEVTKVRIHDDLLQEGLKKKPAKSAASFVTIGEPDIDLNKNSAKNRKIRNC